MSRQSLSNRAVSWIGLCLLIVVGAVQAARDPLQPQAPKVPLEGNLVIASLAGEVTDEVRGVGDQIRYRIYFRNNTAGPGDVVITDRVPDALSEVTPFNNGNFDERSRVITWKVADVPPGRREHVEFTAIVRQIDRISNKATLAMDGRHGIETDAVETRVCGRPDLGWVPFTKDRQKGQGPRAYMKEQTTTGVMLNFDVPGMLVHEVNVEGITFHRLSIPGQAALSDVGKPELPIIGRLIEVPRNVDFKVEIVKAESIPLDCYNVYPAQERVDSERAVEVFTIDEVAYRTDAIYPAELAVFTPRDVGIMRGHRVVFLKVNPVRYNSRTREMEAYSQIEVRLLYREPAQVEPIDARLYSNAFEATLERSVLNYLDQSRFDTNGTPSDAQAVDYLILTHADFYKANDANNPVVRLQNWKRQKGYRTKVVDIADIPGGQTSADIRSYLQGAYKTWSPPPTYILLVGDSEFIPTNYQTAHTFADYNGADTGTDLYYAALDGNDYFPDLFIGRLPVDNLAEAEDAVDRILDYEKTPPASAAFYTDATLIALFEDDTDGPGDPQPADGREDRPWIENVEEIREYLENNNYNGERIYASSSGWPANPADPQPNTYEDNTALPVDLTVAGNPAGGIPGFGWDGDTNDINNALGNGSFLITYRDHGSRGGWSRFIGFDRGDVDNLTNGALCPVVLSVACENGWFDNETDDDATLAGLATGNNSESFAEHWIRNPNGGAVGLIAATRVTWTGHNDFFMFGMHQAVWPDFSPAPPTSGYPGIPNIASGPLRRLGQVLVFGQIYMANAYAASTRRQLQFEMYHLFGDPEMAVWTAEPPQLGVDHPEGLGATGMQDFVVEVTDANTGDPASPATVTLTRNNGTVAVGQTNPGGLARFTMTSPGTGDVQITVTALDYQPYEGTIEINGGGAQINRLDPDSGVEGSSFLIGGTSFSGSEQVQITFDGQPAAAQAASSGEFGQAGVEDVSVSVPSAHPLGPVNVLAHGQTSDRYAVDVFAVRTANPIDLYTYSQWDSSTWSLTTGADPVWDSPDIQVYDGATAVASDSLSVGHNYTFKAKIRNDTAFQAQNATVTFLWANFGVGQDRMWQEAGRDTIDVSATSVAEAEITWAPPDTGHLCMKVEIYHVEDTNEDNNEGQENLHVGPTSSPAAVPFMIYNPTKRPIAVYLEVRQLITPGKDGDDVLWAVRIEQPEPQVIPPGEVRKAVVVFDPKPTDVRQGAVGRFALTAFANGEVIGGAQFEIINR